MYTKDKFKNYDELITHYTRLFDFNALNALFDLVKLDTVKKEENLFLWNAYFKFDETVSWIGCCRSG